MVIVSKCCIFYFTSNYSESTFIWTHMSGCNYEVRQANTCRNILVVTLQGSQRFPGIKFHDFSMIEMPQQWLFNDFSRSGKCIFHFPGFPWFSPGRWEPSTGLVCDCSAKGVISGHVLGSTKNPRNSVHPQTILLLGTRFIVTRLDYAWTHVSRACI